MEINIYHIARTTFCNGRQYGLSASKWRLMCKLAEGPATLEDICEAVKGHRDKCALNSLKTLIGDLSIKYFIRRSCIGKNAEGKYALPDGVIVREFKD